MKILTFSFCAVFSVILLSGCAGLSYDESNSAMKKVVNIDEEPVTRMSFIPSAVNPAAGIEIKLYKSDVSEDTETSSENQN